jgi:hypothetical protein
VHLKVDGDPVAGAAAYVRLPGEGPIARLATQMGLPSRERSGWKRTEALTCVGIASGRERRTSHLVSDEMAPGGRATAL